VGVIHELAVSDLPPNVPLLADVLAVCEGMTVNVEIKNAPQDPGWDPGEAVAALTAATIDEAGWTSGVIVSSFQADTLAAVRAAGERVVIITAKHPISVAPSLRAVGLDADEVFTFVHGPEKAAVLSRVQAAAYVGDSPPDMAAAVQAGVRAVGVATGSFDVSDLERAGAEVVLDSLEGFPAWYRSTL